MRKIAFYSYKGGTGRTLLVANTANFLAKQGHNVVLIDLDLEAPGLIKKFGKNASTGFIDYLDAFLNKSRNLNLRDYIESFNNSIHILPAGNPNHSSYPIKLARINWHYLLEKKIIFSNKTIADSFFKKLIKDIQRLYPKTDYILFDCRTGITTISDIVLNDLSDEIVCLFLNNEENFDGVSRLVKSSIDRNKVIYPVVSRFPTNLLNSDEINKISDINDELKKRIGNNYKLPSISIFHSDVSIEFFEQIKYAEDKVLKHSILLQDYLLFFQRVFNAEINDRDDFRVKDYINLVNYKKEFSSIKNNVSSKPYDFIENDKDRQSDFQDMKRFQFQIVGPKYFNGAKISEFTKEIVTNLESKEQLGIKSKPIKKNINWNLLGFQFSEGAVDFCKDLYYLNETRKNLVDILQIGYLRSFEIIVSVESDIIKEYENITHDKYLESFFVDLTEKEKYRYLVMGDQTAASECYRYFSKIHVTEKSTLYKFVNSEKDEIDIAKKMEEDTNNIAIVDHVTANTIFQNVNSSDNFKSLQFMFRKEIPVGFLYKKNCPNIRFEINQAIYKVLSEGNMKKNWKDISSELQSSFYIDAFNLDELIANIIWDLKLRDALELYNKLNTKNENSAKQN